MRSTDENGLPVIRWRGVGSKWADADRVTLVAGDAPAPVVRLPVTPQPRLVEPKPPPREPARAARRREAGEKFAAHLIVATGLTDTRIASLAHVHIDRVREMRANVQEATP